MESTTLIQFYLPQRVVIAHYSGMSPGERFASLRKARGYGQKSLADLVGMKSDQAISNFEQGRSTKMQADNWRKVAEVLGMSLSELNEAVYGDTIVMAVPAKLGDYVLALIEKSKQLELVGGRPAEEQSSGDRLVSGDVVLKPKPVVENVPVEKKKAKRRDTTSGSAC